MVEMGKDQTAADIISEDIASRGVAVGSVALIESSDGKVSCCLTYLYVKCNINIAKAVAKTVMKFKEYRLYYYKKVLITRRAQHMRTFPGVWVPPGGGVETGDADAVDAAVRELREETGLAVSPEEGQAARILGFWGSLILQSRISLSD